MRFRDKVAIITGAARGIGLAAAKRLGAEGARVVIADLNAEAAEKSAGNVRQAGAPDALGTACDVSSEAQVAATVKAALDRFGRLDVVVNNAGLMTFKSLEDLTPEDWQKVLNVDLFGAVHFTKQAFLTMKPGGAIVNVARACPQLSQMRVAAR
jgi:meso-butanediol dehydrogenase / (S,S)-butanediol dehydrogenase / diacetyl reductase